MADDSYIEKAQKSLDAILVAKKQGGVSTTEPTVPVSVARQEPVYTPQTGRTKTRVLFVTTDLSVLTQTTKSLDGFTAIAEVFHEVHIMVLRTGIPAKHPVLRVAANTWLYTVTAKHQWQLPFMAWRMMQQELSFADGFRPDVLVARDPGVSALAVYGAGCFYNRPAQLHVLEEGGHVVSGVWARWARKWLMGHFQSIRVTTDVHARQIEAAYPDCADIGVLPRFRNYLGLFTGQQGTYLQQKYPQFNFIILYVGELTPTSTAFSAIDAVRAVLRNPRVGFVMVGNGTGVMECERRATLLGIHDQVVIERRADDIAQYVSSADVLLVTDTDAAADEVALYGASAGVPMVLARTPLRNDVFVDGTSAFLIDDVRAARASDTLVQLLNDSQTRLVMRQRVRQVAESRLYVDPSAYQSSYRVSIESAIVSYHTKDA